MAALPDSGVSQNRTNKVAVARSLLSSRYKPHTMRALAGTAFAFHHLSAEVPTGSFNVLRYGSAVEIEPEPFDNFFMLEMPVNGGVNIEACGHESVQSDTSTALFLPPHVRFVSTWQPNCTQLMLKVEKAEVLRRWQHMIDDETAILPHLFPQIDLNTVEGWRVSQLMLLMREELKRTVDSCRGTLSQTPLAGATVDAVLAYCLVHQRDRLGQCPKVLPAHLRRCVVYIDAHLAEDLSIPVLLQQTDISERSLFKLFRHFLKTTPGDYIKTERLKHARRALLRGDKVRSAAHSAGFSHMGRFSAMYRMIYGENPSAT